MMRGAETPTWQTTVLDACLLEMFVRAFLKYCCVRFEEKRGEKA